MAKSIYKVFMGRKSDAWYRLSPEEQQSIVSGRIKVHHSGSNQNAPPWTAVF